MPPTVGGGEFAVFVTFGVGSDVFLTSKVSNSVKEAWKTSDISDYERSWFNHVKKCVIEAGVFGECT